MNKKAEFTTKHINASTIILGFTGPIGGGSTYISKGINKEYSKYKYYKLSDVIRESLKNKGNTTPTVNELQTEGDELRKKHGSSCLIKKLLEKIESDAQIETINGIVIDGIKNEGEVKTLREFPYFFLFSVHADQSIREKRCTDENRFESSDLFFQADKRDQEEELEYGQQVKLCNELSDVIIINNETIPKANIRKKSRFIHEIYDDYIKVIENLREGKETPDRIPSVDELCMAMAYTLTKRSSCIKRKVGAIIIDTCVPLEEFDKINQDDRAMHPPQVVASGYNEVPIGSYPCRYEPSIEKCYRDSLQEIHATKFNYCPSCGKKIDIEVECYRCNKKYKKYLKYCTNCNSEITSPIICKKCKTDIFKEFLPGSKETPGKLLDMCRALHAEENALLTLLNTNRRVIGDLVLYVTTQPCNLCANKIVSAGIKRVCFAEPYLMKESADILKKGKVDLKRFQGVKSSAYFKFYR
ncbi:MAG TPA: deaminase [Desulfomonilia bacterium]